MIDVKKLQQERTQLFHDVYDGNIPKRVPIAIVFAWEAAMQYAKMDIREAYWDYDNYIDFMDKVCADFPSDKQPVVDTLRKHGFYYYLGSKAYIMGEDGTIQHPDVHALKVDEYDEFIEDPYKCMVEKLLQRLNTNLASGKFDSAIDFAKAYKSFYDSSAAAQNAQKITHEKYGYANLPSGGNFYAPFDFLADIPRSFTGILSDIRRCPEKVEAACEALIPLCLAIVMKKNPEPYTKVHLPLHMAPYMNKKQFERFWWPSFSKYVNCLMDAGIGIHLFCENNWMDKIDYLVSLEGNCHFHFEFGDPRFVKEKINGKHIISGLYPVTNLSTLSKQQCIDETKKLLDIVSPNGGHIFDFDKIILNINDKIAENLRAVLDTVVTYGVY